MLDHKPSLTIMFMGFFLSMNTSSLWYHLSVSVSSIKVCHCRRHELLFSFLF